MYVLGYILLAVGVIIEIAGTVMFLVVAYKRSLWWFFGCLLVPLVSLVFFCLNFKATIRPIGLQIVGLLLAAIRCHVAGVIWSSHAP